MSKIKLIQGDNIESLKKLPENSIDSIVTDPPYGLSFMGKKWDYDVPSVDFWKEVLRVLKPGGHVLSFGGTRTYHRMVVNIEDAGFEIRDQIMWLYGSGFPKSHNIGKAVDKIRGNEREWISKSPYKASDDAEKRSAGASQTGRTTHPDITKGTSEWEGWGTALKPANEPICVARKPISEKTITANVLKWGTGGINIDGCRIGTEGGTTKVDIDKDSNTLFEGGRHNSGKVQELNEGRFPANIILDEEAGKVLGEPSRFFYCPKVNKKERNAGCEDLETKKVKEYKNNHPTVKPIELMAYLCRLVTPPNGIVLDPFMGSGSTGCAAVKEGFRFCGMEMDKDYFEIAKKRIQHYNGKEERTKV